MTQTNAVETWMPILVDKYLGDTTHLTTEQHGAYLLLLLSGWKKAGRLPISEQQLATIARMTPQRWKASREVLLAFFTLDGGAYVQKRQIVEIERARQVSAERQKAGKAGAEKRWGGKGAMTADAVANAIAIAMAKLIPNDIANGMATGIANPSQTTSQTDTPIPIHSSSLRSEEENPPARKRAAPPSADRPADVSPEVWRDWCALRAKKRSTASETAVCEARNEAAKAGMTLERFLSVWCVRGSQGLQADWLKSHERESRTAQHATTLAELTGRTSPPQEPRHATGDIIDV